MTQFGDGPAPADHAEIFKRYGPIIFGYLKRQLSTREEAEDLTLDVFTVALSNQDILTWSGPRQLAWLKRVASNKLIDNYRRHQRRPAVALDQVADTLLDEQDIEHSAMRNEDYVHLHLQVKQLPPLQQEVLRLRYGNSLNTSEIATMLNKSDSAIRQILSRTIVLLRTMYNVQPTRKGEGA